MPLIVLASTSPFRRELLAKTGLSFATQAPEVDETARVGESAEELVERLAIAKAQAVAEQLHQSEPTLVIGSDQVAVIDSEILGKPYTHERAVEQLTRASGKRVRFLTGLAVVHSRTGQVQSCIEPFEVEFRDLSNAEIEGYLKLEQPYNCAGSFKSEALGIHLFHRLHGDDPNSLIGLPLIRLLSFLREHNVNPLL